MISWIRYQKNKQQKKKYIDWTSSKFKTLCIKGHYQESEKATHRMREKFANQISDKGLVSRI